MRGGSYFSFVGNYDVLGSFTSGDRNTFTVQEHTQSLRRNLSNNVGFAEIDEGQSFAVQRSTCSRVSGQRCAFTAHFLQQQLEGGSYSSFRGKLMPLVSLSHSSKHIVLPQGGGVGLDIQRCTWDER